ncbi:DUF4136 domain-containing protein [Dyadobacter luticola]|uniref:DUF4136 domain-containing protein n=1 Tax=Dyadobacter luticola TaxID=1979387 RepID=A0A5R9KPN6_9BACT|nr:DUF4136 domain-containing protein [Dyadobacter luticola]TLU98193.1 DUF4136 domain-containing protein [Dyadobacter luticola]
MKKSLQLLLLFSAVLLMDCGSSYKVLKPKKEADFRLSNYATFGFYDIDASGDTIPANFQRNVDIIKTAISENLQSRGLDEARDANLKINIALNVKEQVQTRQTDFRSEGLPRYMGQRRYSWKSEEVVVGKYREGTLMIDLVDAASNKMVWQGGGSGIIPEKSKNFKEDIDNLVRELIAGVPK